MVLVGTHKDELESAQTQLPQAQRLLHDHMKGMFVTGENGILKNLRRPTEGGQKQWFFPVDSKIREEISATRLKSSDEGIIGLRSAIHEAVQNDTRKVKGLPCSPCVPISCVDCTHACATESDLDGVDTPYLKFRMPTRALMLLHTLKHGPKVEGASASGPGRRVCSYADFKAAAKDVGLDHRDEAIERLLHMLSGLGAVNWFPNVAKDLVVLDPRWLLDSMSCLIREHDGHHSQLVEHLEDDTNALPLLRKGDVKHGIFPAKLLDFLWCSDKAEYGALNAKPMELRALKEILEHFGLMCRVQLHPEGDETESEECYVVPPLLPDSIPTDSYMRDYLTCPDAKMCTLICDFSKKKWLQQSVFQRLVCTIVTHLRSSMPVTHLSLTRTVACMYAGNTVLTLRLDAKNWQIQAQTVNYKTCPHSSWWMLNVVRVNMERVLQTFKKRVPYNVLLSADNGQFVSLSELEQGGSMVSLAPTGAHTTSRALRRVNAEPLRSIWLPDSPQSSPVVCWHVWIDFEAECPAYTLLVSSPPEPVTE